jgi:hypothetical protein
MDASVQTTPAQGDDRSLGTLLKELRDEGSTLIRQEVALAKTEMGEKVSRLGTDLASVAVGGGVALVGALTLVAGVAYLLAWALSFAMSYALALWIAWLALGAVLAIVGYTMLNRGLSDLKRQSPLPEKTVQSLKEDQQWLASKTH